MHRIRSSVPVVLVAALAVWLVLPDSGTGPGSGDDARVPGVRVDETSMARSIEAKEARHRARMERIRRGEPAPATHADAALAWRRQMRADADGSVPLNAVIEARDEIRARGIEPRDAGIWDWDWIGPGNIGGRIRSVLFDREDDGKIMVGGVSGGIWETDDGGDSWYHFDDFMANLNVTALARDAVDDATVYASTGEGYTGSAPPGNGVFISTNYGNAWSQLTSTIGLEHVNKVVTHPTDAGRVLIGVGDPDDEVQESFDHGATWDTILSAADPVMDIEFRPGDPTTILVGTKGGGYRSIDGGAGWTNLSVGGLGMLPTGLGRVEFTMHADGTAYALVNDGNGRIYQSLDGGGSWALQHFSTNILNGQGDYDNIIWVDPTSSTRILLGGLDLWRSTDGGQTVTRISRWQDYHRGLSAHADQHAIVPHFYYDGSGDTRVLFGNDGGIQLNDDPWTTTTTTGWTNLAWGLGVTQFYHGAASPDGSVIVGGTQDNDHLRYRPGEGLNGWYQAETGDGGDCVVDPTNPDVIYAEYVYATMEKSTNGGESYSDIWSGISHAGARETALFIAPFEMNPDDSQELVVGTLSVWQTTNGGSSWSQLTGVLPDSTKISAINYAPSDGDEIWAGFSGGRILFSADGGTNWIVRDPVYLPNRYVTDIAIHPTDPDEVWVVFGGYHDEQVWRSMNGGLSWEDRTGSGLTELPEIHVNTITLHPDQPDWIYVGTDLGLFASEDGGQSWNVTPEFAGHDGPANVEITDLFWYDPGMLVAATYGRGMFVSQPLPYVFVDRDHAGSEDGTESNPYDTLSEGVAVAGNGTTIEIASGDYDEAGPLSITRRVTLAPDGPVTVR